MSSGYDIHAVPPAPDTSRYLLGTSPSGFGTAPAANVASVFGHLAAEAKRSLQSISPAAVAVRLKWCAAANGQPVQLDRGDLREVPRWTNVRPSQRWRKLQGGVLLDSLFRREDAWAHAPDLEAFEALAEFVAKEGITGRPLRQLNDELAVLLAARAGVDVNPEHLPHPPSPTEVEKAAEAVAA